MTQRVMQRAMQSWVRSRHLQESESKQDAVRLLESMYAQSETDKNLAFESLKELEEGVELAIEERQNSATALQTQLNWNQRQAGLAKFVASRVMNRAMGKKRRLDVSRAFRQWMRNELTARIDFCTGSSTEVSSGVPSFLLKGR